MIKWVRARNGGNIFPEPLTNGAAEVYENEFVRLEHEVVIAHSGSAANVHGISAQRAAATKEIRVLQATPDVEVAITYTGGTPVIHQEYGIAATSHVWNLDVTNTTQKMLHVQKLETLPDGDVVAICTFVPAVCTGYAIPATT
jgi:hypothetical protein